MDFNLTTEEQLIQKVAKEYSETVIAPLAEQIHATNDVPEEVFQGMRELGFFGINAPEEFGGGGGNYLSFLLAIYELSKSSAGVGMIMSVNNFCHCLIAALGDDEQKATYLPKIIAGEEIASFAFTEASTGSDPKQLTCLATLDGDDYVLNGSKRFITNASFPGPMILVAKEESTGRATAFIIDKFAEGYSLSEPWEKIGVHGGPLYDVYFKDFRVPAKNIMGGLGGGMLILKAAMVYAKVGVCGISLGVATAAYEEALAFAKDKTHRGEPIVKKFEHIRFTLIEMEMKLLAAKWAVYHYAWSLDNNSDLFQLAKEAAMAKAAVTEAGVDIVNQAMSIIGSYGVVTDYKISRLWGDIIIGPQVEGSASTLKAMAASILLM
ncbi:MAG: acyl-CoA dehydrogenase family protein [Coriobacteriia bacterium]|nr:acyl-CoA dehydrogenase family protein [Coriobacteriia bacterium]